MTSQQPRRERAASDRAQAVPPTFPQRPGPPNRTTSAPAGGLPRLDRSRPMLDAGNKVGHTVIEEDESPSSPSPIAVKSPRIAKSSDEIYAKSNLPHVTIAVVGGDGVGKTTFIRCALEMKHSPFSHTTTKKMSLDGAVYVVRLVEVSSKDVTVDNSRGVIWPRLGNDQAPPIVDAALVLHDATKPATLSENSRLIDFLSKYAVPFVLVACKCDGRSQNGPLNQSSKSVGNHEIHRTSAEYPRSQKMCIALALRSIIAQQYDIPLSDYSDIRQHFPGDSSHTRFQTNQSATHDWHHARANSETPTAVFTPTADSDAPALGRTVDGNGESRHPSDHANNSNLAFNAPNPRYARSNSQPVRPQTPPSGVRLNPRRPSASDSTEASPSRDRNRQHRLHTAWRHSAGSDAFNSFLDIDDEMDGPQTTPASPDMNKDKSSEGGSVETGLTFEELVDRLVSLPMSKQDSKFAAIFLCLYRKFAAPASLLNALISRFERNEKHITDQLTRIADQLRLLNIVATWVSEYPGDFAYPKTRKRLTDFVSTLEKSHFYMFAAKEIGSYLEVNVDDDDVGWPFRDGDAEGPDNTETFFDNSGRSSPSLFLTSHLIYEDEDGEEEDPIYSMSALDLSEEPPEASSRLSGTMSNSSAGRSSSTLNQSFTLLSIETAQKEVVNLNLTPKFSLSKLQWRQLMEIPDEDFARELTRMDWIMYNSFRPRDLVRHVSISGPDKDKIKSLQNVNRMIKQFNHLAFFVASMILLRDKPKHRAKALEKFMNIAQRLRRQNNYNSLGAVIAAINGTPVHRLSQTRELVPIQVQKDFMRLVILMGTQKSHFAYRLAWENSFTERIPFLPLHRRDLVSAEEGNKTFLGDNKSRINWKKFEVMGEVILDIQRSQKTPHTHLQKSDEVQRLILETKLSGDEEDLYARSLQVEPSTAGNEVGRKKFGWLRS